MLYLPQSGSPFFFCLSHHSTTLGGQHRQRHISAFVHHNWTFPPVNDGASTFERRAASLCDPVRTRNFTRELAAVKSRVTHVVLPSSSTWTGLLGSRSCDVFGGTFQTGSACQRTRAHTQELRHLEERHFIKQNTAQTSEGELCFHLKREKKKSHI